MGKRLFMASMVVVAFGAAFGAYTIDPSHPVFFFEDETAARSKVANPQFDIAGYDWFDLKRIGELDLTAGKSVTFQAVMKSDHKTVKAWGLSAQRDITKCDNWNNNNSTNFTIAYNSSYSGTYYLYLHLRWFRYNLALMSDGQAVSGWPRSDVCYTNSVALPNLAKAGYTFGGWVGKTSPTVFSGTVTGSKLGVGEDGADIVLTAKWTANSFTVTFNAQGGSVSTASKSVTYNSAYGELPVPERNGYSFLGWYTKADSGVLITANTKVTTAANQTFYAQWEANEYTVTFYNYGATSSGDGTRKVVFGSNPGPLNMIPSWGGGYTFGGYFTGENGTGIMYWDKDGMFVRNAWDIASNTSLHAYKVASAFAVYYDGNGASGDVVQTSGLYGEHVTLRDGSGFSKSGFRFIGWARDPHAVAVEFLGGQSVAVSDLADSSNFKQVTLYAVWKDLRREVNFDYMGGIVGETVRTNLIDGVFGNLPTAEWEGGKYDFVGWFTERAGGDEVTADTVVPDGNGAIVLFARWNAAGFFVEFDGNGEDGDSVQMAAQNLSFDTPQALASNLYTKTGYTFAGWATNAAAAASAEVSYTDGQIVGNLVESAAEIVKLYAVWNANEYYVAFNGNGGEGTMAVQKFVWDQPQALAGNGFSRSATWSFGGWSNTVAKVAYADGETVSNLTPVAGATFELQAIWIDLLTKWSRAADCANLVLNCADGSAWAVDDAVGHRGTSSVYAEFANVKKLHMSARLPCAGTLIFFVKTAFETDNGALSLVNPVTGTVLGGVKINKENQTGDWVQCSLLVSDANGIDVEWRAILNTGDKCWVDDVRWYPGRTVTVASEQQGAAPSGDFVDKIESEVLSHWDAIFGADAADRSRATVLTSNHEANASGVSLALRLGFAPSVSNAVDGTGVAYLRYPAMPSINISGFIVGEESRASVSASVLCGGAKPDWDDSVAGALSIYGSPVPAGGWTQVGADLDTAKYVSGGTAAFAFDTGTNRFFKVVAE